MTTLQGFKDIFFDRLANKASGESCLLTSPREQDLGDQEPGLQPPVKLFPNTAILPGLSHSALAATGCALGVRLPWVTDTNVYFVGSQCHTNGVSPLVGLRPIF